MKKTYIYAIIIFLLILVIMISFKPKQEIIVEENNKAIEEINEVKEDEKIIQKVEIKGFVKNPGVYEFNENERVIDLITKAGGLIENANTSVLNLSKILTDEMVVIIYSNEEIEEAKKDNITIKYETIELPCECPDSLNDACVEEKDDSTKTNIININTATKEELMTLPNIGESKAENIINYRESFKFEAIEDIKEVSGIGESLFEKIKDYITV